MTKSPEFKKDYFFAFLACVCWFVAFPTMLFAGVWGDWRWFATAPITVLVGFLLAGLSSAIDKSFERRGVRK